MLEWTWATERLAAARNYWIVTSSVDGGPHAAPVWGLWIDDAVVFSTSPESRKGRDLAHDPRVVVHLESGNEVVIVEGEVETIGMEEQIADA
jgi:pyridoxine/pyridoxamine 5'-phosphate oxidase